MLSRAQAAQEAPPLAAKGCLQPAERRASGSWTSECSRAGAAGPEPRAAQTRELALASATAPLPPRPAALLDLGHRG